MTPEYKAFTGYIKEMLRDTVAPLFEEANVNMKEFERINICSDLEYRYRDTVNFTFQYSSYDLIMPLLSDDPDLPKRLRGGNPKYFKDKSIKELAEQYFNYHKYSFVHEAGHFLDSLIRSWRKIVDEWDDWDTDMSLNTEKGTMEFEINYFSQPAEMIAVINEIKTMKLDGMSDNEIIKQLQWSGQPKSYIESLISMAKKKEERTVFGKYITIIAVEQDTSAIVLDQWLDAGFREVVWIYQEEPWQDNKKWLEMGGTCPTCLALGGQHFKIQDLLADMTHDAPKYSKSHVGCKCLMKRLPREEEILDYPEETPITEEAPKAEEPPKPEEPQNL